MTPLISSIGAASVRGLGRGRILTRLIPFTSISSVTSDNNGSVTIAWTANQTTGYRIQLYVNGVLNVQGPATLTGSTVVNVGTCITRTYQMKLQNIATGIIEAESNSVTYESNAYVYGTELSFTCTGCNKSSTRSTGVCGGTYNDGTANSFSCCSPISYAYITLYTNSITYDFGVNGPYTYDGFIELWSVSGACANGTSISGGPFGQYGGGTNGTLNLFGLCFGPGEYYARLSLTIGSGTETYYEVFDSNIVSLS